MGAVVEIIKSKDLRGELMDRLDVLDKVKEVVTLCGTPVATMEQVANFYGVGTEAVRSVVRRNEEEITSNGAGLCKKSKVIDLLNCQSSRLKTNLEIKPMQGKSIATLNGESVIIPNRGIWLFSRKSMLNIGMLLEESKVAEQVRRYLLNAEEKLQEPQKVEIVNDITEEQKLILDVIQARNDNDRMIALSRLNTYKDAEKQKFQDKVEDLMNSDATFTIREAKNNLGVKERALTDYLIKNRYCYRQAYSRKLRPYAAYTSGDKEYFREVKGLRKDTLVAYTNIVMTVDGIEFFRTKTSEINQG